MEHVVSQVIDVVESRMDTLIGAAVPILAFVLGWLIRWLRRDGASARQRELLDAMVRRLQDSSRDWRAFDETPINKETHLQEFDEDNHSIALVTLSGNAAAEGLGVAYLLTPKQRWILGKEAAKRLKRIKDHQLDLAIAAATTMADKRP